MTFRLIALMSVTLFCCLAAFGLLLSWSEGAIMEEVERTVSEAGEQTIRAFAQRELRVVTDGPGGPAGMFLPGMAGLAGLGSPVPTILDACDCPIHQAVARPRGVMITMKGRVNGTTVERTGPPPEIDELFDRLREGLGEEFSGDGPSIDTYVVAASTVMTESGDGEIRAQLPMFRFAPTGEGAVMLELGPSHGVLEGSDGMFLSLPTKDYAALFGEVRERTLFLMLGVFVLGTILSAGLARRFTRPIRELDRGFRQVSGGDLEASVAVAGGDEVARLGTGFNDMTRRLRAGRERERELTRQEKLSALGRLAAGVAHDVRNPLHSIGLALQHMRETCAPEAPARRDEFEISVDRMRGEVRRLDALVGNFLRFAKSEPRERQSTDIGELAREIERLVAKEAENRGVRVLVDAPSENLVAVDAEGIRSALLNLVLNAFEAMPDGGDVTLRVRPKSGGVAVEVADSGRGIPPEVRDRVFEFGFTTREDGYGMGLAIVHRVVVEEHGGDVAIRSDGGEGTTVSIELPADGGDA